MARQKLLKKVQHLLKYSQWLTQPRVKASFRPCSACHALDGTDGVGPRLNGVVDRAVGSVDGFGYSGSLVAVAEQWTPENLNAFLESPKGFAPGTAMAYNGMRKIEDRANLIAYLQSVQ